MTYLELRLMLILQANQDVFGTLALDYRYKRAPHEDTLRRFTSIPAIAFLRMEHSDAELARALTAVIERIIERMEMTP